MPPGNVIRIGRGFRLFRLLKILRVFRVLRFLKVVRLISQYWNGLEPLLDILDIKLMKRTLAWSTVITLISSILIYQFESPYANFESWYDGVWWGITTILTGGFTDLHNPATFVGYFVTIILIISGMVLIGVFVASLSSVIEVGSDDVVGSVKNFVDSRCNEIDKKLIVLSNKIDDINNTRVKK